MAFFKYLLQKLRKKTLIQKLVDKSWFSGRIKLLPEIGLLFIITTSAIILRIRATESDKYGKTSLNLGIMIFLKIIVLLQIFFIGKYSRTCTHKKEKLNFAIKSIKFVILLGISFVFSQENYLIKSRGQSQEISFTELSFHTQLLNVSYLLSVHLNLINFGSVILQTFLKMLCFTLGLLNDEIYGTHGSFEIVAGLGLILIVVICLSYSAWEELSILAYEKLLRGLIDDLDLLILVLGKDNDLIYANKKAHETLSLHHFEPSKVISLLASSPITKLDTANEMDESKYSATLSSRKKKGKPRSNFNMKNYSILDLLKEPYRAEAVKETYFFDLPTILKSENYLESELLELSSKRETHSRRQLQQYYLKVFGFKNENMGLNGAKTIVFNDVSESKKILKLSEETDLKFKLLKSFSHELHTALNGSIALLDCALEDQSVVAAFKEGFLGQMEVSLKTLKYFISDVTDYLKLQTEEMKVDIIPVSLLDIVGDIFKLMEKKTRAKGLKFEYSTSLVENPILNTDPEKVKQILLNLITNCLKYTTEGGISLEFRDSLTYTGWVEVEIEDTRFMKTKSVSSLNSCSPPNSSSPLEYFLEEQEKEFRVFMSKNLVKLLSPPEKWDFFQQEFRAECGISYLFYLEKNNSGIKSSKFEGLGMGKKFDSIFFRAAPKKSSVVAFDSRDIKIPSIEEEEEGIELENFQFNGKDEGNTQIPPSRRDLLSVSLSAVDVSNTIVTKKTITLDRPSKKALIVDDDPFNILSLEQILSKENYKCLKAFNGKQAIDTLVNYYKNRSDADPNVEVIFMDLNMPEMDGLQSAEILLELMNADHLPHIPIICCSANDSDTDIKKCQMVGMSGFVSKPITIRKIRETMKSLEVDR